MDNTDKYPPQSPSQGVPCDTGNDAGDASRGSGRAPSQGVPSDTGTIDKGIGKSGGKSGPSQGVKPNLQP